MGKRRHEDDDDGSDGKDGSDGSLADTAASSSSLHAEDGRSHSAQDGSSQFVVRGDKRQKTTTANGSNVPPLAAACEALASVVATALATQQTLHVMQILNSACVELLREQLTVRPRDDYSAVMRQYLQHTQEIHNTLTPARSTQTPPSPFAFAPSAAAATSSPGFTFGTPAAERATTTSTTSGAFSFGATSSSASSSAPFAFGFGGAAASSSSALPFATPSFGAPAAPTPPVASGFTFGSSSSGSGSTGGLAFGSAAASSTSTSSGFGFGFNSTSSSPAPASGIFSSSSSSTPSGAFGSASAASAAIPLPDTFGGATAAGGFLAAANTSAGPWNDPTLLRHRIQDTDITPLRQLSSGGFGDVWLSEFKGKRVAVKRLAIADQTKATAIVFAAEIALMSQLQHTKITTFVGVQWTKEWEAQALSECMERGDLRSFLDKQSEAASASSLSLTWADFKCQVAIDVADALAYLQSRSPAPVTLEILRSKNVLLCDDDGDDHEGHCKLSVFAAARSRSIQEILSARIAAAPYLAPEIILDIANGKCDRSVIYSFGVLLCELDTTMVPYHDAVNPDSSKMASFKIEQLVALRKLQPTLSDECPASIAALARECLAFDPLQRPTAASIVYRLREILKGEL